MNNNALYLAPMVGRTDMFFRSFIRILSENINLFTEMITCDAFIYTDRKEYKVADYEHYLTIQLAGQDPQKYIVCSKIINDNNYDEINLNIGCPSSKVVKGAFGACLMKSPDTVAEIVERIRENTDVPISIKTRLGLDYNESLDLLDELIEKTSRVGCEKFFIHARNAVLGKLSPKKNRTIPNLRYDDALLIKKKYPELSFVLNGGVDEINKIKKYSPLFNGIMIGRKIYDDPMFIYDIEKTFSMNSSILSRKQILENYLDKTSKYHGKVSNYLILRHLYGLYYNTHLSKKWKKFLHKIIHDESNINQLIEFKEN